mgnify:CR=1 FL=1
MRLLVAVSNEPLAHAIHGALLAGRHEVSLASTGSIALAAVAKESFLMNPCSAFPPSSSSNPYAMPVPPSRFCC